MEAKQVPALCASTHHVGRPEEATYVVWEARPTMTMLGDALHAVIGGRAFAACERHLHNGLTHVFAEGATFAIVRKEETVTP